MHASRPAPPRPSRRHAWVTALVCAPALALTAPATALAVGDPEVLASGLVGPLALSSPNDGTVYVSESFAGRLTAVSPSGGTSTVAEGPVAGVDATGRGTLTVTLSAPPEAGGEPLGEVARVEDDGAFRAIGSTLEHETATNPDGDQTYGFVDAGEDCLAQAAAFGAAPYTGIVESNPYAVLVDRSDRLVADAAANAVVRVRPNGRVSTVAVLPPVPTEFTEETRQALLAQVPPEEGLPDDLFVPCVGLTYLAEPVPTDVERGPDGALYVSSLPGFPEAPGTGAVFRVDPATGDVERLHEGFSGAVDLAVADDGTLYVAELFGGALTRVSPDGSRDSVLLDSPGAVEVGRDGALYVSTGVFGDGSVLRYESWPTG